MREELQWLGWNDRLEESFAEFAEDLEPGRVVVEHRGAYAVQTASGELLAEITGRMRFDATGAGDLPAAGDWVAVRPLPGGGGSIQAVLPRATKLSRKAPGRETAEQVIAANIDVAFCVDAMSGRIRARRLERYVAAAWDSGATPVVVLTKADLCADLEGALEAAQAAAVGVAVHVTCGTTGDGVSDLLPYFEGNRTAAMLGPSGVGKSTLINRLAGRDVQETAEIRGDGRGRHTTTRRELVLLPEGGIVLDTPGMRELSLWEDDGLSGTFEDVESLAESCRFNDCGHVREPGCAIRAALADGTLELERLEAYRKLQRETAFLERRQDVRASLNEKKRWKNITKAHRQRSKLDAKFQRD